MASLKDRFKAAMVLGGVGDSVSSSLQKQKFTK